MFTGIISDIGCLELIEPHAEGDTHLTIVTSYDAESINIGASIACSGVCLTVTDKGYIKGSQRESDKSWFGVTVSQETLKRTLIKDWQRGDAINLERALVHGEEMGGHIVKGHVDGLAKIHQITPIGDSYRVDIIIPKNYKYYIAEKGSITINGISLTINEINGNIFSLNIIPHTWEYTTMKDQKESGLVHFEVDILARYAYRLVKSGMMNEYIESS